MGTRGNFRVFLPIFLVLCLTLPLLLPVSVSAESKPDPRSTVLSPDDPLAPLTPPELDGNGAPVGTPKTKAEAQKMKADMQKWAEEMRKQAQEAKKQLQGNKDVQKKLDERRKEREEERKKAKPEKLPISVTIRSSWGNRGPDCRLSGHADLTLNGNLYRDNPSSPFYLIQEGEPIEAEVDFENLVVCASETNLVDSTPHRIVFKGGVTLRDIVGKTPGRQDVRGGVTLSPDDPLAPLTPPDPKVYDPLAQIKEGKGATTAGGTVFADPVPWFAGVPVSRALITQKRGHIPESPPTGGAYVRNGPENDWLRVTGTVNFEPRYVSGGQGTIRQSFAFQLMLERDKAYLEGNSSWATENHVVPPGQFRYGIANGTGSVGHILDIKKFPDRDPNSWMDHKVAWRIGKSDRPDVSLTGCIEQLGPEQPGTITAKGEPPGGSYRFQVDSPTTLAVEEQGASANVRCTEPGHATVSVEYTTADGKTGRASQPGTCLRVESINGGHPVPKIGLYDETGKRAPATRSVPVSLQPADAGDLLVYKPADPGILTAVSEGESVLLQGVRQGKTTFRAETRCGGGTGPVVAVEVVPCDDEVQKKLAEEERIIKENLKQQLQEDENIRSGEEFNKAANNIEKSATDVFVKTGSLIVGTLATEAGAVKTAADIIGYGSNVRDVLVSPDAQTFATSTLQTIVQTGKSSFRSAISGAIDTLGAANQFGDDLGTLIGTSRRLEEIRKSYEQWSHLLEDVMGRKKICRSGTEQPPKPSEPPAPPPKKDPPPKTKKDPSPREEPPPTKIEPPRETPGEPPSEPPGEPPPPPSPTSPSRQAALPYDERQCGCGQSGMASQAAGSSMVGGTSHASGGALPTGIAAGSEGIGQISKGLENVGHCVEQFRNGPLVQYRQTLDEWEVAFRDVQAVGTVDESERKTAVDGLITRLDSLIGRTKDFDGTGRAFYAGFETCPAAIESATGLLLSAPPMGASQ